MSNFDRKVNVTIKRAKKQIHLVFPSVSNFDRKVNVTIKRAKKQIHLVFPSVSVNVTIKRAKKQIHLVFPSVSNFDRGTIRRRPRQRCERSQRKIIDMASFLRRYRAARPMVSGSFTNFMLLNIRKKSSNFWWNKKNNIPLQRLLGMTAPLLWTHDGSVVT